MPSLLVPSVRKPISACLPSHLHTMPIRFLPPVIWLPEALTLLFLTSFYFFFLHSSNWLFCWPFWYVYLLCGWLWSEPGQGERCPGVRVCVCVCVWWVLGGSLWRRMLVSRLPCPLRLKRDSRGGLGLKHSRLCVSPGPDSVLLQHTQEKPWSPTHMPTDHIWVSCVSSSCSTYNECIGFTQNLVLVDQSTVKML